MGLGVCFFAGSVLFFGVCILSGAWGNSLALFELDATALACSICGIAVFAGFAIAFTLFAPNLRIPRAAVCVPTAAAIVVQLNFRIARAIAFTLFALNLRIARVGLGRQRTPTCWADAKAHQHDSTIAGLCEDAIPVAARECLLFGRCREADGFLLAFRIMSGTDRSRRSIRALDSEAAIARATQS
jgi:hypothetical protein